MTQITKSALFVALGLFLLAEAGCSKPPAMDAKTVAMHRTRLSLADEPDGIQTVADVRATLLGEEHADHDDHDHDGDGQPDHAAEDHDEADHDEADHDDHDHDEAAHDDHDHDGDGHPDHAADEHDHDHDHAHAHATEPQQVSVVGHIGGLANPWVNVHKEYPFAKSQAVLFLADPQAVIENEEAGHVHAPGEECAFCAAHAADKADLIALVQFVDENGKVLKVDVRELFDVKERDTVVVKGDARVTEGGILVVNAQGMYVRK